jgi:hypothetical protein
MKSRGEFWAILLPDGRLDEGSRLASRKGGIFSPLRMALQIAWERVPPARTVVVSTPRDLVPTLPVAIPAGNHLRLPCDRGSGVSVLVALLWILERDPRASVVVIGADEVACRLGTLREALCEAVAPLARMPQRIVLVGVTPEPSARAQGWILPRRGSALESSREVAVFWEKPNRRNARLLLENGALVRTTVLAAVGSSLLEIYRLCVPHLVASLSPTRRGPWWWPKRSRTALDSVDRVPPCDLWQDVMQRAFDCLSLVTVERSRERGHDAVWNPSAAVPMPDQRSRGWSLPGWAPALADKVGVAG